MSRSQHLVRPDFAHPQAAVGLDAPCSRRRWLGLSAALLGGGGLAACGTPLPLQGVPTDGTAEGQALLQAAADAHGWAAYRQITDISVAYDGAWRPFIDRIQPIVVDTTFRGPSEERLLPQAGVVAQAYRGPAGRKHVWWQRAAGTPGDNAAAAGQAAVWFNGQPSASADVLAASALVAECYGLFLLGPLWLNGRGLAARVAGTERVDGRLCAVLQVDLRPGLGRVARDRVALCLDRDTRVARRLRFTLEGFSATAGAVAFVDTFEHARHFGVLWPMRSYEEVEHPLRVPAHDWRITGLDVNRGLTADELRGPAFSGRAAAPAAALAKG
jgi:hypothetical protein